MDISGILSGVSTASSLILVNPKKNYGVTPQDTSDESFLFHYTGEESVSLQSDITDHFVEDNTTRQDHIALRPEVVTVTGYVGELNNVTPEALEAVKSAADKLTMVSAFTPSLSSSALIAYNTAAQVYALQEKASNAAVEALGLISGTEIGAPTQNKQQIAFNKFYAWYKARRLFVVQTPWAVFNDMAIMSLRATQGEDTRVITDFEISFKKMNFAKTLTESGKKMSGRAAAQSSAVRNNGTSQPKSDVGALSKMSSTKVAG